MDYDHVIVGGGIYGCYAALRLKQLHPAAKVLILEREKELFRHASYNNQARIHNGYHYPRSILTGIRSRANLPRFMSEFSDAVVTDFGQYYAIGHRLSLVTPGQFEQFCSRIGASLAPAPEQVARIFDEDLIEAVYSVVEPVFDAAKLRGIMQGRLAEAGAELRLNTEAVRITRDSGDRPSPLHLEIFDRETAARSEIACERLYNCTYARLNDLLARSGLSTIRLRHEATEMALIEPPPPLRNLSLTVMCGPFFSLMPFPARGLSTLSHVRYTPHYGWTDEPGDEPYSGYKPQFPLASRYDRMVRDASRYLPVIADAHHVDSLWAVKTILPQSDANDSRPILYKHDPDAPNVVSILGGKIDNIFDLDDIFAGAPESAESLT
jgi:glycine/D-amino acid oxidase-like deaminating enzyme